MLEKPPQLRVLWNQYKISIIGLTILTLLYFILRLSNLLIWPIFADEAIYIRWSQVMRAEPTLRFLPLTDGKQPFFMWLTIPFLKIFSDPLYAGRFVSVLAGWGSMFGIYALTTYISKFLDNVSPRNFLQKINLPFFNLGKITLHNSQIIALIATALYVIVPYTLFFDRYSLADSLLNMLGIWSIVFALHNLTSPRWDLTFLTGASLGAAWLTKSPAMFFLFLVPASSLIIAPQLIRNPWQIFRLIISWSISLVIAFVIYNLLRLGPEFHQVALRNLDYVFPLQEVLAHPLEPLERNLKEVLRFYWHLLTPVIIILAVFGIIQLLRRHLFLTLYLLAWGLTPILAQSFIARTVTARYFLYTTTPWLIFAALGAYLLLSQKRKLALTLSVMLLILLDILILHYPNKAWLPRIERSGYLEEWTAGTGLDQIASYISQVAEQEPVVVGTEGYFGTTPDGLQIYFNQHPKVTVQGNSHILETVPKSLYDSLDQNRVFFVINDERFNAKEDPQTMGLKLIESFPKAVRPDGTQQHLLFYEVISTPSTNE